DGLDVAVGIEAPGTEHVTQLLTDVTFESLERCRIELDTTGTALLPRGQPRLAGDPYHVQHHGLVRIAGVVICAHADREVHVDLTEIAARTVHHGRTQLLERAPVAQLRVGIDQGDLGTQGKGFLLLRGK